MLEKAFDYKNTKTHTTNYDVTKQSRIGRRGRRVRAVTGAEEEPRPGKGNAPKGMLVGEHRPKNSTATSIRAETVKLIK